VTPAQAEQLTLAGNEGRIQLVLRNGGDQTIEKTEGSSLAALYGGHTQIGSTAGQGEARPAPRRRPEPIAVAPLAAPPAAPPAPVPDQIITIRGIDKKVETVAAKKNSEDAGRNP
jgi:hypothetical protein